MQVSIPDNIVHSRDAAQMSRVIWEGVIIRDYIAGEISIGEVKDLLGCPYVDDAMDWLHARGIATTRKLPPELERIANENMGKLAEELGI